MAQTLEFNKTVQQMAPLDIPELGDDLDYISKLDDEPNDVGGLTAAELKAEFDKAGNAVKRYVNDKLVPALSAMEEVEAQRHLAETERVANETERVENELARVAAESQRALAMETALDEAGAALEEAGAALEEARKVSAAAENGDFDGKSAYEIACDNGFEGTEAEWLESLPGGGSPSSSGGCATGTYFGTGGNAVTLTFDFAPKALFIECSEPFTWYPDGGDYPMETAMPRFACWLGGPRLLVLDANGEWATANVGGCVAVNGNTIELTNISGTMNDTLAGGAAPYTYIAFG